MTKGAKSEQQRVEAVQFGLNVGDTALSPCDVVVREGQRTGGGHFKITLVGDSAIVLAKRIGAAACDVGATLDRRVKLGRFAFKQRAKLMHAFGQLFRQVTLPELAQALPRPNLLGMCGGRLSPCGRQCQGWPVP